MSLYSFLGVPDAQLCMLTNKSTVSSQPDQCLLQGPGRDGGGGWEERGTSCHLTQPSGGGARGPIHAAPRATADSASAQQERRRPGQPTAADEAPPPSRPPRSPAAQRAARSGGRPRRGDLPRPRLEGSAGLVLGPPVGHAGRGGGRTGWRAGAGGRGQGRGRGGRRAGHAPRRPEGSRRRLGQVGLWSPPRGADRER